MTAERIPASEVARLRAVWRERYAEPEEAPATFVELVATCALAFGTVLALLVFGLERAS